MFSAEVFKGRAERLAQSLREEREDFSYALIVDRVNMYWLSGTMQNAVLLLLAEGQVLLLVRRSQQRARDESPLEHIYPIQSYRDILEYLPKKPGSVFIEKEVMPLAMYERIGKYVEIKNALSLDRHIAELRAVKDGQEITLMREAGKRHRELLVEKVPHLLKEGMSECELAGEIYREALELGHHGIMRMNMFQSDIAVGQIAFGSNSLYPTNFDGPGGMRGLHPATPVLGSRERKLKKGDLVFVDMGFCYKGYLSDKTQIYSYGGRPEPVAEQKHEACRRVLAAAVAMLRPGNSCQQVWQASEAARDPLLQENYMGYGQAAVRFLGHGLGMQIDEAPVIMDGNKALLKEGMLIALEPKCGVQGQGLVGVEESYLVQKNGADCITGGDLPIIRV